MIKLFILIIFLCIGNYPLRADEGLNGDQDFMEKLTIIKDPFEEGLPKPIIVAPKPVVPIEEPKKPLVVEGPKPKPKRIALPKPIIKVPSLHLQGVMVGGGMNEAIIDDTIVPLGGIIRGAKIISVSSEGVGLIFKGKKFFLKVE